MEKLRTANGSMLRLAVDDDDWIADGHLWFGQVRLIPRHGQRVGSVDMWLVETAPVSSLDSYVESVGGVLLEEFELKGGRLQLYRATGSVEGRWAAWLGPWHLLHGMFYSPQWRAEDVVDYFGRLSWTDTADGLLIDPGARFTIEDTRYLRPVAGVGMFSVRSQAVASASVPRHRGLACQAGEVWRLDPLAVKGEDPLLFATQTAVALLQPDDLPIAHGGRRVQKATAARGTGSRAVEFLTHVSALEWRD